MSYAVTLIPGDGTGPELTEATRRVLEATGAGFDWEVVHAGADVMEEYGTPLPEHVLASIRKNRVALKGPITTPIGTGFRSVNVALRQELALYCCLRPCKTYPGVPSRYRGVDLVVVRENTEDLYAGIEFQKDSAEAEDFYHFVTARRGNVLRPDSGYSIKPISESGTRRIVKFAFEHARAQNRRKVTAVTKANIMKYTDGLFLAVAREVAKDYHEIDFEERLIDNLCMQLVRDPLQFDVMVMPNLYGDIVSDICAGLVGGLGMAPGGNIGDQVALFEPTHGSAPKYTGMNKVNPLAMILSGVMLLTYLGEDERAARLEKAVAAVVAAGKEVTYDLVSEAPERAVGTSQVADAVIRALGA